MEQADPSETTYLLRAWANGDPTALERLTPHVYQELRRLAGHYMRDEQPGRTLHARKVQVVELRFFGGLSVEETAAVLKVSTRTVELDWTLAKAWLSAEMSGERVGD